MGTAAITAALNLGIGLFKAHTARLAGATNENEAIAQLAPAIQADLEEVGEYVSSGQVSVQDAISFVESIDQQTQGYLQKLQGQPGVSWFANYNGPITFVTSNPQVNLGQGVACDKNCTVGCCVYFNSWKPAFTAFEILLQSGKPFSVTVGPMQSNKYGFPGFPAYTIQVSPSPASTVSAVESTVTNAADLLTGQLNPSSTSGAVSIGAKSSINPLYIIGGIAILGLGIFLVKEKRS